MTKRKSGRTSSKGFGEAVGFRNKIENDTIAFFLGLVLLAFSVLLIISMVSYLSTGKADQSILEHLKPWELFNSGHEFTNYCGSLGAWASYMLISVNFGLPAFLIPVFLILASLKLMHAYSVGLLKSFFCLMVVMIWSSIALAKFLAPFMGNEVYNPGGNHGAYCVDHIEMLIGAPGLTALLILTAIAFLTYLSTETIVYIRRMMNPVKYLTKHVKLTINHPTDPEAEEPADEQATNEPADNNVADEAAEADDEKPQVVDLTDYAQAATAKSDVHLEPVLTTTVSGETDKNSEPELKVDPMKVEETASGKVPTTTPNLDVPINPWEPFTKYKFPTFNLLKKYDNKTVIDMDEVKANNNRIIEVLRNFGVEISQINATVGPTVTLYEITPAPGVRISKIRNLEDDIALSLSALGIRIIAPIPGKGTIGIEVPNAKPAIVSMESILNSKKFQETTMDLPCALGKTITNEVFMFDLAKAPHLLVAGATGQGKSVGLNAILTSLLYKKHPAELKIVLVDPKKVEFSIYATIEKHFLAKIPDEESDPIITDVTKVVRTLNSLCKEMDTRYDLLKMAQARNIKEYNKKFIDRQLNPEHGHKYMPYIVVVIDEFGDLIMTAGKEIELPIARIAQLARAVGIHMIIATQRPTTNIITGTIKANFPSRIAFRVGAMIDSRTILDRPGAQQLIGRGDMLYLNGGEPVRVQCAFVDTPEVERINQFICQQQGYLSAFELPEPDTDDGDGGESRDVDMQHLDPMFEDAARLIVREQSGSTSLIQRKFAIGYNRAGRLMDQLEKAGIVGQAHGSKPREVLIMDETSLENLLLQWRG